MADDSCEHFCPCGIDAREFFIETQRGIFGRVFPDKRHLFLHGAIEKIMFSLEKRDSLVIGEGAVISHEDIRLSRTDPGTGKTA